MLHLSKKNSKSFFKIRKLSFILALKNTLPKPKGTFCNISAILYWSAPRALIS